MFGWEKPILQCFMARCVRKYWVGCRNLGFIEVVHLVFGSFCFRKPHGLLGKTYFWQLSGVGSFYFLGKTHGYFWEKTCILAVLCVGNFCFLGKTHGFLGKNLYQHIVLGNVGLVGPSSLGLIEVVHFWQFFISRKNPWLFGKKPIFILLLAVLALLVVGHSLYQEKPMVVLGKKPFQEKPLVLWGKRMNAYGVGQN